MHRERDDWMKQALCAAIGILVTTALFGAGKAESAWHIVEGSSGEKYAFTQAVTGNGMLSVDFMGNQHVMFRLDCDAAIDSGWCATVSVRLDDGTTVNQVWEETEDHKGVFLEETGQCAFLALLQRARTIEIRVPTCTTTIIDATFLVGGLSRISTEAMAGKA